MPASGCYTRREPRMMRSTKIVATLGPASSDPAVLERMVRAGVDVVRLNFSHGTAQDHENRAGLVKHIASKTGRTVAILCDLQGPKIRVGKFKDNKVTLEKGQKFILDAAMVPSGPVNTYAQLFGDPQVRHLEMVVAADDPELGRVLHVRTPVRLSRSRIAVRTVAPRLGAHTDEVLGALGYDAAALDALRRDRII